MNKKNKHELGLQLIAPFFTKNDSSNLLFIPLLIAILYNSLSLNNAERIIQFGVTKFSSSKSDEIQTVLLAE